MYLQRQRQRDPCDLQEAIFDFSTANGWWKEVDLPEALMASVVGENDDDGYGVDPRRHDWRKWESDLEATET
ncbi:hypothetical protein NEMBOFW57_008248 [Staphylotrichum longicolle]|uniref:Uncharacterized protein n=1 Tax=Staphylotrichum longicolle TaxID=669026 RepID=A0AAD4EUS0_9PEZI|nr:hypothetical protein NEMBOFW57_008248 [Staphylotrichum longicolle]